VSLSDILGTAASGLAASQAGLGSVANNIANVNTPGYAREKTNVTTSVSAGRVGGVTVAEPERVADRFLESTVYRRAGDAGQAETVSDYLDQLQSYLGSPGADTGLPSDLNDVLAKATSMTGSQDASATRNGFVTSTKNAIDGIDQLGDDIDGLRTTSATRSTGSTICSSRSTNITTRSPSSRRPGAAPRARRTSACRRCRS
jgi:flagellar hook-associated protein 1